MLPFDRHLAAVDRVASDQGWVRVLHLCTEHNKHLLFINPKNVIILTSKKNNLPWVIKTYTLKQVFVITMLNDKMYVPYKIMSL